LTDSSRTVEIQFDIDSVYLKKNAVAVNLSKEIIKIIKEKRNKRKYKTIDYSISGVAIGTGLLIFVIRRRKKKKKA